jgi:hypothetical protein
MITLATFSLITIYGLVMSIEPKPTPKTDPIEQMIRNRLTERELSEYYRPAAIYYKPDKGVEWRYCCVGTICRETNVLKFITSEHVFRTDAAGRQAFKVVPFRERKGDRALYIEEILSSSKELRSQDIVIARLGDKPTYIEPFSDYVGSEMNRCHWGEVSIGNRKVPLVTSLINGEKFQTVGYADRLGKDVAFVVLDTRSLAGESGTGLIDEHGGLWVLHGKPDSSTESSIIAECKTLSGREIHSVTCISGPIGGRYN